MMNFETIYRKYNQDVMKIALMYSKNQHDAKDIAQETFIRVFKKFHTLSDHDKIKWWILRICKNTSINFVRAKRAGNEFFESMAKPTMNTGEENLILSDIHNLINPLPTGYRTVLTLKMDGYKHDEIAEMLNCSKNTSKSQFSRARKMLQNQMINE